MTSTDEQASATGTTTETAIAQIWADLLEVTQIGPDDDFFDLGATSLTAVRFLARVEERFGSDALTPEQLYEDARLRHLAKSIDDHRT
jgi:acyl carrier protein